VLFLQDNASSHKADITHQKLADLHSEVLKYPTFSPDLAPSDYQLFPNFEKPLQGIKSFTNEDAMSAAYEWFADQPSAFYLCSLEKLEQKSKKCVQLKGEYTEQSMCVKICSSLSLSQSQRLISIPSYFELEFIFPF